MTSPLCDFHVDPPTHRVDAWSVRRLPYDKLSPSMRDLREKLRAAIPTLNGEGSLLAATYTSDETEGRSKYDLENVLLYNVHTSLRLCVRGIRLERSFRRPVPAPVELSASGRHHYYYALSDDRSFAEWEYCSDKPLASFKFCLPTLDSDLAEVWLAAHRGSIARDGESLNGHLALVVRVVSPRLVCFPTPAVMKRLLDGIVSAWHVHDGTKLDEVSERIALRVNGAAADVKELLMHNSAAVLGSCKLVWPYRKDKKDSVQWGPADHRLVAILVTIEPAPDPISQDFTFRAELYTAKNRENRSAPLASM